MGIELVGDLAGILHFVEPKEKAGAKKEAVAPQKATPPRIDPGGVNFRWLRGRI
ncbi:hypothetical protein [Pseudidiomarina halophila]|uniref:hypothetical protein n=1 Tax=Pseudidiomarina halophila TaxID=1449799 RepID=UPI0036236496